MMNFQMNWNNAATTAEPAVSFEKGRALSGNRAVVCTLSSEDFDAGMIAYVQKRGLSEELGRDEL